MEFDNLSVYNCSPLFWNITKFCDFTLIGLLLDPPTNIMIGNDQVSF